MKLENRIEAINQVLGSFGMFLFSTKRGHYIVESTAVEHWTGSDGESNSRPRFSFSFCAKASELTIETVRAASISVRNKTLEEAAAEVATEEAVHEEAMRPVREESERLQNQHEEAVKAASEKVENEEYLTRCDDSLRRVASPDALKLEWFQKQCVSKGTLVADHYREEFLRLTAEDGVLQMALEVLRLRDPALLLSGHEGMLKVNAEVHRRGIKGSKSLGGTQDALLYLIGA